MPSISAALKMYDSMSGPLKSLTQGMNLMLSAMFQMQEAADRNVNLDKTLVSAKEMLASAEADMALGLHHTAAAQAALNQTIANQPEPKIPQWTSFTTPEIFKGSGIERFKMEIADADNAINRLVENQTNLSAKANSMNILPPDAKLDIDTVHQRLIGIYDQMQQIVNRQSSIGQMDASEINRLNAQYELLRGHLHTAVAAQHELNTAMSQGDLSAANAAYRRLHTQVDAVEYAIRDNIQYQERFNRTLQSGTRSANGLLSQIRSMAAVYLSFQGIKQLVGETVGGAMQQQQMIDTFAARTGSKGLGFDIYDRLKKQALNYRQDINAALTGGMSFMSNTMDPTKLEQLNKLAMRLSKLNPAEGLQGAAFSLKELMSGDYTSIAERFNMSRNLLKGSAARKAGLAGDVDAFIKGMNDLLNKQHMTEEAFEEMLDSPAAKWQKIINKFKDNLRNVGQRALGAITSLIDKINTLDGGSFFDSLGNALAWAANAAGKLFDAAYAVYAFFTRNWGMIAPVVWGVVMAFIAYKAVLMAINIVQGIKNTLDLISATNAAMKAGMSMKAAAAHIAEATSCSAATAAQWGLNAALLACPFTWIIAAILVIIVLIYAVVGAINKMAGTSKSAAGYILGAFAFLGAALWNLFLGVFDMILGVISTLINTFIQFTEFLGNIFVNPVSSIIYLFQGLADDILAILQKVASAIDFVFGTKAADAVADWRAGLKDMADFAVAKYAPNENYQKIMNELNLNANDLGLKRWDYSDAWAAGYKAGENLLKGFDLGKALNMPFDSDINRVNEVGSINDTVDISSEDLKLMRELAEMKNIQNFVTLHPTSNITFTGAISKEVDVHKVIAEIEEVVRKDMISSAEGVYGV